MADYERTDRLGAETHLFICTFSAFIASLSKDTMRRIIFASFLSSLTTTLATIGEENTIQYFFPIYLPRCVVVGLDWFAHYQRK